MAKFLINKKKIQIGFLTLFHLSGYYLRQDNFGLDVWIFLPSFSDPDINICLAMFICDLTNSNYACIEVCDEIKDQWAVKSGYCLT